MLRDATDAVADFDSVAEALVVAVPVALNEAAPLGDGDSEFDFEAALLEVADDTTVRVAELLDRGDTVAVPDSDDEALGGVLAMLLLADATQPRGREQCWH